VFTDQAILPSWH